MNLKNSIILFMFLSVIVPFVLVNNFYPFFRFGMFAEPIKNTRQTDFFEIYFTQNKKKKLFTSELIGLPDGHFSYIIRSYYYKNKSKQLLRQIHQFLNKNDTISRWELIKKQLQSSKSDSPHTNIVIWLPYE